MKSRDGQWEQVRSFGKKAVWRTGVALLLCGCIGWVSANPKLLQYSTYAAMSLLDPAQTVGAMLRDSSSAAAPDENLDEASPITSEDILASLISPSGGPSSAAQSSIVQSQPPPSSSMAPQQANYKINEVTFKSETGGSYVNFGTVCLKNSSTKYQVNIEEELKKRPEVHIGSEDKPYVLIMHTHTTESYEPADALNYDPVTEYRTAEKSRSVVAVGDAITEQLKAAGIGVIHDTTYHDYPSYTGAYDKAAVTIKKYLSEYPSIQVVLDIHRDAIEQSDGTRIKPITTIDGKKAAQVMIITGCDEPGSSLPFPNWEYNLRLAVRLQQQISTDYPTLARPIDFYPRRYNMNLTYGSLLLEFGTHANTLEQAVYTGQLVGKSLGKVLQGLKF